MPFARHPLFVTSLNRMGLWIERLFGIARVEFRHVGALRALRRAPTRICGL